eukprot:scaffold2863_cov25-Phaeocystis_antarctica.AAC.1
MGGSAARRCERVRSAARGARAAVHQDGIEPVGQWAEGVFVLVVETDAALDAMAVLPAAAVAGCARLAVLVSRVGAAIAGSAAVPPW